MTMKVLIDLSVVKDSVTHRTALERRTIPWGDITPEVEVAVRVPFLPRPNEEFRLEQLGYLAALPELVASGRVKLFRSVEQMMEDARNPRKDRGYLGLDLLEGVAVGSVPPPVQRTFVFAGHGRSFGVTKEEQVAWFKSINDNRFRQIRGAVSDAHIGDAFHFWTAEHNGLDAYLTMDRAFINVFKHQAEQRLGSGVKVMAPKDLCTAFSIGPRDINELERENPPFR